MASIPEKIKSLKHGGNIWGFSREYGIPIEEVKDFSGTVNPLGAPTKAIEAIQETSRLVEAYPDPNPIGLKEAISQYVGEVKIENIIVGNGSTELIYLFTELFAGSGSVIIPVPAFTEYKKAVLKSGSKPVQVRMKNDFSLNVEGIKNKIAEDTKMVFICNPHSPSGTLYDRGEVLDLVDFCLERRIFVFIDENYIDFVDSDENFSVAPYVDEYKNIFVTRSLSKFFGLPGLRLGFGIAAEKTVQFMEETRSPWNINALAISGGKAALRDKKFIQKTKQLISRERVKLWEMLKEIDELEVIPSAVNFFLVKILDEDITSGSLKEMMGEKANILIRDCSDFVGLDNSYFRITIKTSEENARIVKVLKEIFSEN